MKAHRSTRCGVSRPHPLFTPRGLVRRFVSLIPGLALAAALLLAATPARAQAPAEGTVTGQVLDASSGKYLEGADVQLAGTNRHQATGREGVFAFTSVPAGEQSLVVTYFGLSPKTMPVTITAGQPASVTVVLNSDVVQMSAFKVTSMKEGMSQAVSLQKVSIQSKMVAAADQFCEVSEGAQCADPVYQQHGDIPDPAGPRGDEGEASRRRHRERNRGRAGHPAPLLVVSPVV